MIESRLTEQRARLVMIVKQGAVPEELENEKIVEMQLQKRQVRRIVIIICDNRAIYTRKNKTRLT